MHILFLSEQVECARGDLPVVADLFVRLSQSLYFSV
jgi:hypothetical protein